MKSKLLFLLIILFCLVLTGCGKVSKEKMMKNSLEFSNSEFFESYRNNEARTIKEYEGNNYIFVGEVIEINEKFAIVNFYLSCGDWAKYQDHMNVFFDQDELLKLENKELIKFVGKINKISKNNSIEMEIKNPYLISTNNEEDYTFEGKLGLSATGDVSLIPSNNTFVHLIGIRGNGTLLEANINGEWYEQGIKIKVTGKFHYVPNEQYACRYVTGPSIEIVN